MDRPPTRRPAAPPGAQAVLVLLLCAILVGLGATPAWSHAVLEQTVPPDGAVVETVPDQVVLRFSEAVRQQPDGVRVVDSSGERVDTGDASQPAPDALAVGLPGDLADGTYVTAWRTVSADGHPIRGAFVFSVGQAGPSAGDAVIAEILGGDSDAAWQVAAGAARWLGYATTLLAAGGLLFLLWVRDRAAVDGVALARIPRAAAIAGIVVTLAAVGVQAALASGFGVAAFTSGEVLGNVLAGPFGTAALLRLAGLAVVALAAGGLHRPGGRLAGLAGALLASSFFVFTGHTVTTDPRWLAATANFAHTLAGGAWFGGLVLLAVALRRRSRRADAVGGARMVAEFSSFALAAVAVVVAGGAALAWAEVRVLAGLWTTAYGRTLLVKVVAVAGILGIAVYNRRRLVPAIAGAAQGLSDRVAWRRLSRAVRLEALGVVVVLLVTAVLTALTPARAELSGPFTEYAPVGDLEVNLTVDPARVGSNEVHVYLLTPGGQPADAAESAMVRMTQVGEDIGPIEREPTVAGPGHWTFTGPELSVAGTWEITLSFQLSQFEERSATFAVEVR